LWAKSRIASAVLLLIGGEDLKASSQVERRFKERASAPENRITSLAVSKSPLKSIPTKAY
jgi:hypothetical protein